MGDNNYVRVTIPPCIYNGFEEKENAPTIIANCATHPHDPQEILRLGPNDRSIHYN